MCRSSSPHLWNRLRAPEHKTKGAFDVSIVFASEIRGGWGHSIFMPDGRILLSLRSGELRIVGRDGVLSAPISGLPPVAHGRPGRPSRGFRSLISTLISRQTSLIYWSYSEPKGRWQRHLPCESGAVWVPKGGTSRLESVQVLSPPAADVDDSKLHFGSRIVFAKDGHALPHHG